MPPKQTRVLQPSHLTVDDAWRVLQDAYCDDDLQELRQADAKGESKLAFQYNHRSGGDKDALYKYRNVVKQFAKINNTLSVAVWQVRG